MKRFVPLVAVAVAFAGLSAPASAGTTSVAWKKGYKKSITVRKGTTVRFVWSDNLAHNMVGAISKGNIRGRGKAVSARFSRSGTVYCSLPGHAMYVRVNVR